MLSLIFIFPNDMPVYIYIYNWIAGHVVVLLLTKEAKSPIFRPVTFLVAFGVVSVAHWAYSTGKVPSNNFRLRPPPHSQNVTN